MFGAFSYENASIVQDGLLMHLDFGSNSQNYASPVPTNSSYFDLSGNSNSGRVTSGSLVYDASFGFVDFNSTLPSGSQIQPNTETNWYRQLTTGSFTMQAWLNWDVITGDPCLLAQGDTINNSGLHVIARSNKLNFSMFNNDLSSVSDLTIGRWQMFTFVYYGFAPWRKEIWFDNRLDASHNGNQYLGAPTVGGPNNFNLGFINWVSFKGNPFNGKAGNFLFYKKALTASDINQNYEATKNRFNIFR
jgi:hypothetical protein